MLWHGLECPGHEPSKIHLLVANDAAAVYQISRDAHDRFGYKAIGVSQTLWEGDLEYPITKATLTATGRLWAVGYETDPVGTTRRTDDAGPFSYLFVISRGPGDQEFKSSRYRRSKPGYGATPILPAAPYFEDIIVDNHNRLVWILLGAGDGDVTKIAQFDAEVGTGVGDFAIGDAVGPVNEHRWYCRTWRLAKWNLGVIQWYVLGGGVRYALIDNHGTVIWKELLENEFGVQPQFIPGPDGTALLKKHFNTLNLTDGGFSIFSLRDRVWRHFDIVENGQSPASDPDGRRDGVPQVRERVAP